jgi:hypothetical protein
LNGPSGFGDAGDKFNMTPRQSSPSVSSRFHQSCKLNP